MPGDGRSAGARIEVTAREIGAGVVLAPTGELSLRTVPELRVVLEKHLADRGRVLVDLAGLPVTWAPAVEVFPLALATAGGWPAARLVLFGAGASRRVARRMAGVVHLADTEEAAVELLAVRPPRLSRRAELPCVPEAAQWARIMAEHTSADWGLDAATGWDAKIPVSELVTNAVLHARTTIAVSFTFGPVGLCVAVRDYRAETAVSQVRAAGMHAERPLGLRVVAGVSRSWGVRRHVDGRRCWPCSAAGTGLSDRRDGR